MFDNATDSVAHSHERRAAQHSDVKAQYRDRQQERSNMKHQHRFVRASGANAPSVTMRAHVKCEEQARRLWTR